jgi:uncharacterized coiled-coil protein SlyX
MGGGNKDKENQCLGCGKQCTSQQFSVQCTLCSLWCHRECGGISEAYFKALELQMREMGTAFWACRSCLSFAAKVNTQFKDMDKRIGEVSARTETVSKTVEEHTAEIAETRGDVKRLEEKMKDMEKRIEERMCEEMREREIRRLNLVLHHVEEPNHRIKDGKERMEADRKECEKIFKAAKARTTGENIKFCRRIGERGDDPRPLLIGLNSEDEKKHLLEKARELQKTVYKDVTIGPDLTHKQRQEEKSLREEVERKNREEITEDDVAKNLEWMLVGPRGAKRIIKGVNKEGEVRGRGRGRPPAVKRKTGQQNKRIRDSDSEEESRMDAQESQRTRRK